MKINSKKLVLDVSDTIPAKVNHGAPTHIAVRVFFPEKQNLAQRPAVVCALNGGTYDWRYFHVQVPGENDYSVAEFLAAAGHIVVLPDHLGIGDSSRVAEPMLANRHVVAAACHGAMEQIFLQLSSGEIAEDLPAISEFDRVGVGHSMGAMQTITQQANHQTYDRIAVLGYTAKGVHLHINGQLVSADPGPISEDEPPYSLPDRQLLRASFHWEDVPEHVLAVDDQLLVEVPTTIGKQASTGGIVTGDAAKIAVPVFIALGERDVSPLPHMEPYFYSASRDVQLFILPKSAHCHSFASTRGQLNRRLLRWLGDAQ